MTVRSDLDAAVLAFERATRWFTVAAVLEDDPFRLELPPTSWGGRISAATMELLGGLYLVAEVEQTGLLRVAELLVEDRMALDLRSIEAAERLEAAAAEAHEWFRAEDRDLLFARVFGVGRAATTDIANQRFPALLLDLVSAIDTWGAAQHVWPPPAPGRTATIRQRAEALRANLADRQHGNTIPAARRIARQVRTAVEILGHPGVLALVGGRSMWDVVRAMVTTDSLDVDGHVTRGQSGQVLIGWAGSPAGEVGEPPVSIVDAAARWLAASGFTAGDAA